VLHCRVRCRKRLDHGMVDCCVGVLLFTSLGLYAGLSVCIYVCMSVCACVCMYVCMYVCVYLCMYVCTYVRADGPFPVRVRPVRKNFDASSWLHTYACLRLHACVYVCTYVSMYMYVRTRGRTISCEGQAGLASGFRSRRVNPVCARDTRRDCDCL